jgi:hypothetical protein
MNGDSLNDLCFLCFLCGESLRYLIGTPLTAEPSAIMMLPEGL